MLRTSFYQQSMLEVDPDEVGLRKDSFERGLRSLLPCLVSLEDFRAFHPHAMGAPTCCPLVLTAMLLLQFRFNLTDTQLIERCQRDLGFRYSLALPRGRPAPKVSSLRRFRTWVDEEKGPEWIFRLSLALARDEGLIADSDRQVVDSSDTDCRGAIIDTFNLIATAIHQVIRNVARCLACETSELAEKWGLSRYLARSIKGAAGIDWSSESERNALLTREIRDADRLPRLVAGLGVELPENIGEALELLAKVARQDVEDQPDGTFRIAKGTAPGRIVSMTDPEARHGRKSSSKAITGFKTHVEGTIESQFVTGIVITDAGMHDAKPTLDLIEQAADVGLKPKELLGDCAYGTGANRRACREAGVELRTKLPTPSHTCFTKRDFRIDLASKEVTCPNGVTTTTYSEVKDPSGSGEMVPNFRFPKEVCQECPLRERCGSVTAKGRGRLIALSRYEAEIQESQRYNAMPEAKVTLKKRSAVERLISHLVRMGMRHARFFGMHRVQFQAYMTAAAYNLQRYITLKAA
jgi:IS5 family transposase